MLGLGSGTNPTNAIELLKTDHDEVEKLFDQYQDAKDQSNAELKAQIVAAVCKALTLHAQLEEELFYPAMRKDVEEAAGLIDEAAVEHETVRNLVEELESAAPGDELYDAKVKVLSEYVKHHVKEEEGEIFPLARKSGIDLDALGRKLMQRKSELQMEAPAAARRRSRNSTPKRAPSRESAAAKTPTTTTRKAGVHGRH